MKRSFVVFLVVEGDIVVGFERCVAVVWCREGFAVLQVIPLCCQIAITNVTCTFFVYITVFVVVSKCHVFREVLGFLIFGTNYEEELISVLSFVGIECTRIGGLLAVFLNLIDKGHAFVYLIVH